MAGLDEMSIGRASYEIASDLAGDSFERLPVTPPKAENLLVEIASMTSVYTLPGQSDPLLHKAYFSNPDIPPDELKIAEDFCIGHIEGPAIGTGHNEARRIAEDIAAAYETIEAGAEDNPSFRTIGVLAVYISNKGPLSYVFANKPLVDELSSRIPSLPPEVPDEAYRRVYVLQAEKRTDIPAYEVWKAQMKDLRAALDNSENRNRILAGGLITLLLMPDKDMNPVLKSKLFKQQS